MRPAAGGEPGVSGAAPSAPVPGGGGIVVEAVVAAGPNQSKLESLEQPQLTIADESDRESCTDETEEQTALPSSEHLVRQDAPQEQGEPEGQCEHGEQGEAPDHGPGPGPEFGMHLTTMLAHAEKQIISIRSAINHTAPEVKRARSDAEAQEGRDVAALVVEMRAEGRPRTEPPRIQQPSAQGIVRSARLSIARQRVSQLCTQLERLEAECNAVRSMQLVAREEAGYDVRKCNPKCCDIDENVPDDQDAEPDTGQYLELELEMDMEVEDYYHPMHAVARDSDYRSAVAHITFALEGRMWERAPSVVDSGAAMTGMDAAHFQKHFPGVKLTATQRRFRDASKRSMEVLGTVTMQFHLGMHVFTTEVYVFRNLGAPVLLGVNAMHKNGIDILFSRNQLCHADQCVPLHPTAAMAAASECKCTTALKYDADTATLSVTAPKTSIRVPTHQLALSTGPPDEGVSDEGVADEMVQHEDLAPADEAELAAHGWIPLRATKKIVFNPRRRAKVIPLEYEQYIEGPARAVKVETARSFITEFPALQCASSQLHNSMNLHAILVASNQSDDRVIVSKGTVVAYARAADYQPKGSGVHLAEPDSSTVRLRFRVEVERRASWTNWADLGTTAPSSVVHCVDGTFEAMNRRELKHDKLSVALARKMTFSDEELEELGCHRHLYLTSVVKGADGRYYAPTTELEFSKGGRPRVVEDLHSLGFTLEKAIDPDLPRIKGAYQPLSEERKQVLYGLALTYWSVWSRDAKTPELSRLIVLEVPTGDSPPVAQRPYPIPYKYLDAVRKEVQTLLDGGLIEPCISNWASPTLVRLKKDSTPESIRLKLIIDFRRLNEVTVPDNAGLGDQDEILDGFGGDQRYCGIVDAAGGFYQYLVSPRDRHKTAFVLPTSMGGTSFQWRVAPYGLTRNPAGYSRGMMYALKGLDHCSLDGGLGHGGAKSWIDDVSMHANTFGGFVELFGLVLMRLSYASMSLKASKCFLLHARLEVLGYFVTPDGLVMQESKLEDLENRDAEGHRTAPRNVKEIRTFLGAVQFYRRFVPRIALLAAPMNALLKSMPEGDPRLKSGTPEHAKAFEGVRQSFEAIMTFLKSSAIVAAPDLSDPLAEYVVCTDACDIAAGGVLCQWQYPGSNGPGPPTGVPLRGGKGPDPLTQSWRHAAGWKLRTIAYYSKTFDVAQKNYPTFDKESAAIVLCVRRWAKLITGHPTTIYTDSSVASSMLTKHLGPARLQRWGIELGTFLPYLKIQYRKGSENGMADFLSRYPTFEEYVARPSQVARLEFEHDVVGEVPLFTHDLLDGDDQSWLQSWKVSIAEARLPAEATHIWQDENADVISHVAHAGGDHLLELATTRALEDSAFWKEQREFANYTAHMDRYVEVFESTFHRPPVVYDLCCGEGGWSRGARAGGGECYGFDKDLSCKQRYETEFGADPVGLPSGMTFIHADVLVDQFWRDLSAGAEGPYGHLPAPDIIHMSPPCAILSRLASLGGEAPRQNTFTIDWCIKQLDDYARSRREAVTWEVENVPESLDSTKSRVEGVVKLCGTMMGHRVFKHRVFYCNYSPDLSTLRCNHSSKAVGTRGVTPHISKVVPVPNMYGVYSKPYGRRGSSSEWHAALGAPAYTYSQKGIAGALPLGYGHLLFGHMVAHVLNRRVGCPIFLPSQHDTVTSAAMDVWTVEGYRRIVNGCIEAEPVDIAMVEDPLDLFPTLDEEAAEAAAEDTAADAAREATGVTAPEIETIPGDFEDRFSVSATDQSSDPSLRYIIDRLENARPAVRAVLREKYAIDSGILHRRHVAQDGEIKLLVCVPERLRGPLLAHFHYKNHRGYRPLLDQLMAHYWWNNMRDDCYTFVQACEVCGHRAPKPLHYAPTNPVDTPARPFQVIHVDHKGPLPKRKSGDYHHILVVTCALTRFTLLIPVHNVTAEETLKVLHGRVYSIFGTPLVLVSDNGPAFIHSMTQAASSLLGYRHIHVLPYNAQANGIAESSVGRIKKLLDRQTDGYQQWHILLPTLQLLLNTTVHTGTGVSPYVALFGREPNSVEQLENPALLPPVGDGHEFLQNLRGRMVEMHARLRKYSDALKKARAKEENDRHHSRVEHGKFGVIRASTDQESHYVWLIHGSKEQAVYVRKHGHGMPWKHKYKVLEVKPTAVRLEIPTDGSVPRVNEWQLIRRVTPASAGSHSPGADAPRVTESGTLVPGAVEDTSPAPASAGDGGLEDASDDHLYDIERISHAVKVGRGYHVYVIWKGYPADQASPRWRHELVQEVSDPSLLKQIDDAVQACKERADAERGAISAEADDDMEPVPPPAQTEQDDEPLGRGAPRRGHKPVDFRYQSYLDSFMFDELLAPAALRVR